MIPTPYLLFLGDAPDMLAAKVAVGIRDWRPDHAVGQLSLPGCAAPLGLREMTLEEGRAAGARTLVIGVANRGGTISEAWLAVLRDALAAGYDLASGLHELLRDEPSLVEAAERHGRTLHDVRVPSVRYPIAEGRRRAGRRCLAVGTDCSVGKMYAAMAMEAEMRRRGMAATFRATGQTGILVSGGGVPLDAVVADFMAGSVEWLTPDNDPGHWDLIEGQGSLYHPSYSGVTLALIHGGAPDALILAHEPTRTHMRGLPHYDMPEIADLHDLSLELAQRVNRGCVVSGVAVNTQALDERGARRVCAEIEAELGLPTVDPIRHGAGRLVDALPS